MILRNHGLLVGGTSIPEAFLNIYMLERACAAQVDALSGGREIILPPPEVCQHTSDQFASHEHDEHYAMVWNAALRLIEGRQARLPQLTNRWPSPSSATPAW